MAGSMGRNAFAFRIDYAKAIADDERQIAHLGSPAMVALAPMTRRLVELVPDSRVEMWDIFSWLTMVPDQRARVMACLGLTEDDACAWSVHRDWYAPDPARPPLVDVSGWDIADVRAAVARGKEVEARFNSDAFPLYSEERRVELFRLARASLARHRRNQKKYAL